MRGLFILLVLMGCRGGSAATSDSGDVKAPAATLPGTAGLTLGADARRKAGIETEALGATTAAGTVVLAGTLIADPSRITVIEAPIAGRLAVVDGAHWPAYGERVAAGAVLAQVSDAKPLVADRAGVVTRVGAQPGQIVQAGQVLLEVTDFSEPLARIVWRSDLRAPSTIRVSPLDAGVVVTGRLVGLAPDADSLTRLPVYLYRASRSWPGAGPGTAVQATVAAGGSASHGLFVPADAVVQWEGLAWVYIEVAAPAPRVGADHGGEKEIEKKSEKKEIFSRRVPVETSRGGSSHLADTSHRESSHLADTSHRESSHLVDTTRGEFFYRRVRVDTSHPVPGGWVIPPDGPSSIGETLAIGDNVVVRGAQQLLSEEFKSRATTGDDDAQ